MENVQLLPDNEVKEVEGRLYINPQVGIDETNTFIDKFRDTQKGNTQEISTQTQMLGTDVPSSLGGLTGAGSYFTSRYQTPQTNTVAQNLRAAAQATALNEALANEEAMWKKRYNDAYRKYQKRQNDKSNNPTTNNPNADPNKAGDVTKKTYNDFVYEGVTPGVPSGYTVSNIDTDNGTVIGQTYVPYGQEGKVNYHSVTSGNYGYNRVIANLYKGTDGNYYARKDDGSYEYLGRPE